MAELIFRALMIGLMIIFAAHLGFKQYSSLYGFDSRILIVFGVLAFFMLLLGPLWPTNRKIEAANSFFEHYPRSSAIAGYLAMSISGFLLAGASATESIQWSYPVKSISQILGPAGMASICVMFGLAGLVGVINVLKRKS